MNIQTWNMWKLQALLMGGLMLIAADYISGGGLTLGIPKGLDVYLIISSFYFALDPQTRIQKRRQELLVLLLFPGAFVTVLLPLYALLLILARYTNLF